MKVPEIVTWGRSLAEYRLMFGLSDGDRSGRILGCGDGPASFNAEATEAGFAVVSCDPIYRESGGEIRRRVEAVCETMIEQVKLHADGFVWEFHRDPEGLRRTRLGALERFLGDFDRGKLEGRYVTAALPSLPFADGEFRLALVSHLLFLYSEHLDARFHLESGFELLRVAEEVRIFPLLKVDRRWSPHVEAVRAALEEAGHAVEIVATAYEFQRADDHAGNRMMRIRRRASVPSSGDQIDRASGRRTSDNGGTDHGPSH
jgi:hypothetical protein